MSRSHLLLIVTSVLSLSLLTNAHGYLNSITVKGQTFIGNIPHVTSFASPIRLVDDIVPVKGASNPDLNCGIRAQKAQMVVDVDPGSAISLGWISGNNIEYWPHNIGPIVTYMAECKNTTCDQFDSTKARWFKIDEAGKKPDSDVWYQNDIMQGDTYTTHIPDSLPPGDYLIRHEIIALHLGNEPGGAEFYPSCSQVRVSGNNTTPLPSDSELVSFPGAYKDDDPGIFDPTIFNPGANYTSFPGPEIISSFSANSSGGVLITGRAPTTTTMQLPGPSQTPKPFTNIDLGVVESVVLPGIPAPSGSVVPSSSNNSNSNLGSSIVNAGDASISSSSLPSRPSVSPRPSASCKDSKKKRDFTGLPYGMKAKRHLHIAREERPKVLSRIMSNVNAAGH